MRVRICSKAFVGNANLSLFQNWSRTVYQVVNVLLYRNGSAQVQGEV